ncbi:MAG: hypothetical protein ACTHU0_33075 [Kofleriaceae bacterium]
MSLRSTLLSLLAVPLLVPACTDDLAPELGAVESELSCPVSGTDIHRSLVVTLDTAEQRKPFSFERVMTRLRATASEGVPVPEPANPNTALYQQWMRTYDNGIGGCADPSIDPNGFGLACPRVEEVTELASLDPFARGALTTFEPIALFNRFDLAPSNGSHCGEYRIVFAKFPNDGGDRALFIFEAALPNPAPSRGIAACLPVAQYWQDLTHDPDPASRLAKLEAFYFTDGTVPGFAAAVNAHHYGLNDSPAISLDPPPGQIRTNLFVGPEWNLREFKIGRPPCGSLDPRSCGIRFAHVTVKENPADELFRGTHGLRTAFRAAFVDIVPSLAAADVNAIAMPTANQFNEFESVSQRTDVAYSTFADASIRRLITAKLADIGSPLTPDHVLRRATTQTCAGCHELSNNENLGPASAPLIWPSSARFVHVDELSSPIALSNALEKVFLPHRRDVLEKFINATCSGTVGPAGLGGAGLTIGGSPEGSPN